MCNEDKFLNQFINEIKTREKKELLKDKKSKEEHWTEEVIIPKLIYERISKHEKLNWILCDFREIYSDEDSKSIFGVKLSELNVCFSKKFYKLSKEELKTWEKIGKIIDTKLPINDILIIYTY